MIREMTQTGEFMGMPPTGTSVTLHAVDIFRLAGGHVAEQWTEFDSMSLMQPLGVMPAAAPAAG